MARFVVCWWILVNAHLVSFIAANSEEIQVSEEAVTAGKTAPPSPSPSPSPSEAVRVDEGGNAGSEEEVMRSHHHHRSFDRSVVGGAAVIGVLATGFLVAVFCYIRATRRHHVQPATAASPTTKNIEEANFLAHP